MYILRLDQVSEKQGEYSLNLMLDDGEQQHIVTTHFEFQPAPNDQEDLRWYFEDYLQYSLDPAPRIAIRIERRITEIGEELFKLVFHSSNATRKLWKKVQEHLYHVRVEIAASEQNTLEIPWELLRDPESDSTLSLQVGSFVRVERLTKGKLLQPINSSPVRILLVICRPGGVDDVRFRSIAAELIRGLEEKGSHFQLEVLRPATFTRLQEVLQSAWEIGTPYHIVHFDGHGTYQESPFHKAKRGFLWFESSVSGKPDAIPGELLGKLLSKYGVLVVVLNACRSAYVESPPEPQKNIAEDNRSFAFGSLASELMSTGILGVVAMRYNVYVVTAAQFMADLYERLAQGYSFGEAVSLGRRGLSEHPLRKAGLSVLPLHDWYVPVVYEAYPLKLFAETEKVFVSKQNNLQFSSTVKELNSTELSIAPAIGFVGGDQTLLELDRAFDKNWLVLLSGYAGAGKTAIASEFARWYLQTGGLPNGQVLFTSFKEHRSLADLLRQVGTVFVADLKNQNLDWPTLTNTERYRIALLLNDN